jgi:glycosyltransferase involved in cell wall biosynthesis
LKILYACNDLDYFKAHRWFLADAMSRKGWDVSLSVGGIPGSKYSHDTGELKIIPVNLDRHKLNVSSDVKLLADYVSQLRKEKPDVVHAMTIKPVLFMGVALMINRLLLGKKIKLVLTYPGLGKVFEPDPGIKAGIRKFIVSSLLKLSNATLKPHATFENHVSMDELSSQGIVSSARASVVMGAGIDQKLFFAEERTGNLKVLFASRLINAKGLGEYIEAARQLKKKYPEVEFQVAGRAESDNPDAYDLQALKAHDRAGDIDYLGEFSPHDIAAVIRKSDIHVAPSKLQEGLPRVVLEAATCGCYIIATDHDMLRLFIKTGENGTLLKEVTVDTVCNALQVALNSPEHTRELGAETAGKMSKLPIFEENIIAHFEKLYQN